MPTISQLFVHPLKSCRAASVSTLELDAVGPCDDRRWMVVDSSGRFVSLRTVPGLTQLDAEPLEGGLLRLQLGGRSVVARPTASLLEVHVWRDSLEARVADEDACTWIAERLDLPGARLVALNQPRDTDPRYAAGGAVGFADGYPLLVATESAVADACGVTGVDVDPRRFRPNVVLAGVGLGEDAGWRTLRCGEVILDLVKPCERCIAIDVDPATGARDERSLVRALARREPGPPVVLGWNAVSRRPGVLRVGDAVEVLA